MLKNCLRIIVWNNSKRVEKDGNVFSLHAVIPANTAATIYLPAIAENTILESNVALDQQKDIKRL